MQSLEAIPQSEDLVRSRPTTRSGKDAQRLLRYQSSPSLSAAAVQIPRRDVRLSTYVNGTETRPVQIDTSTAATDTIGYVVTVTSKIRHPHIQHPSPKALGSESRLPMRRQSPTTPTPGFPVASSLQPCAEQEPSPRHRSEILFYPPRLWCRRQPRARAPTPPPHLSASTLRR